MISRTAVLVLTTMMFFARMTILMITHELAIAQCADKIYHILDGQLRTYDEQQEGGAGNEEAE